MILIPLLIITVFFTRNLGDHPVKVVDWKPVLTQARSEAPYPVLAPVNLPDTWRATQASWVKVGQRTDNDAPSVRNAWTLGFLDPSQTYISLYQGDLQSDDLVRSATREATADGSSTIEGQTWERRVSPDQRTRSLVLITPEVTTVVAGDTSYEALESYVSTLRSS